VRRTLILAAAAAALLAGCGNKQTNAPDVGKIAPPGKFVLAAFPKQGVTFKRPSTWSLVVGTAPQVATVSAGEGQIVIWNFPRTEPLPVTRAQLGAARNALLGAVKQRDRTFALKSSRIVLKPSYAGVELIGTGTNQGVRREVRSLHAFGNASEIVVDEFAPPKDFGRVDKETFGAVARSLRLLKPGAK
jgi:hypothetical protein